MEAANEIKIISMLGEMNNKITTISMNIKDIKESMNRNFGLLVDAQISANDKLNKISDSIEDINFRLQVAEAGVGFNANKIKELNNIKWCDKLHSV